jgi:hypothetical protein
MMPGDGGTEMQPEKKFRAGAVSATVWMNSTEKGSFPSVQLSKSYMDKEKNWKETSSFGANDLPKALLVLNEAYRFVAMKGPEKVEAV